MRKQYLVRLTEDERTELDGLVRRGVAQARRLTRARILLLADAGRGDREITAALGCGMSTVERARRKYHDGGVDHALSERPRPGGTAKLDGTGEAALIALACADPPAGRACWTMQLLANRLIELQLVDAISDETVRRTLKKTSSNPGRPSSGVFLR
jgi:transposase